MKSTNAYKTNKQNIMKLVFILIALSGVLFTSCASSKKYKAANAQIESKNARIDSLNKQVASQQQAIDQLKTENVQYGKEAEDCRKLKEALAQRVEKINKALNEKGTSMKDIKEKAEKALEIFANMGATVTYRLGLVHVSIPDKLAFPTGSIKMSDAGRQAISVIADVLIDNPGVNAVIIGNTDSIPVTKTYKDNWSLSTERANAVVRSLRDTYKIDPARLTAAGKGKYAPVADNGTTEGRAKNRRTEIILNPNLDILWELSEDQ